MLGFRQGRGSFVLILILLVLIVTTVVLVFALQTDPIGQILKEDQLLNILFVLEDQGTPLFTNVLVYYPESRRGGLFDIPGNTGLIIKSLGRVDRIDAVYVEKGIEAYRDEIAQLTGISIPFYIVINLEQFAAITDLMGGLKVFISHPVDIVNNSVRHLLPSGSVLLDGDKIKSYVTYILPEEKSADQQDRRQGAVIAFLWSLNKKSNVLFDKNIFPLFEKNLKANLDSKTLYNLLYQVSSVDSERLVPLTVTGSFRVVDGKTLLFPENDGLLIKEVFKKTMAVLVSSSETAHNRTYVLEVQNGTPIQGLARKTSALFQGFGYDVLSVTNAAKNDYTHTVLIDHIGNEVVAKNLAEIIRCTNIMTDDVKDSDTSADAAPLVDFTLIVGRDFDGRYVQK